VTDARLLTVKDSHVDRPTRSPESGMGMTEVPRNLRESCGDGSWCCWVVPVGMEWNFVAIAAGLVHFAGLPRVCSFVPILFYGAHQATKNVSSAKNLGAFYWRGLIFSERISICRRPSICLSVCL